MWGYVGRRLLAFIPTVFVAVTLIFILTRLVPGNPVWALLGHQSVSAEQIDAVAREMGLDRPILIQYLNWLPKVLSGNFGQSIFYEQPVAVVIAERFPVTLSIAGLSTLVTVLVAVPMGVLAATKRNSALDHASMVISILGVSIPSFWLGFCSSCCSPSRWDGSRPPATETCRSGCGNGCAAWCCRCWP